MGQRIRQRRKHPRERARQPAQPSTRQLAPQQLLSLASSALQGTAAAQADGRPGLSPAGVLALQRTAGNAAVNRLLAQRTQGVAPTGGMTVQRDPTTLQSIGAISLDLAGGDVDKAAQFARLLARFTPQQLFRLRGHLPGDVAQLKTQCDLLIPLTDQFDTGAIIALYEAFPRAFRSARRAEMLLHFASTGGQEQTIDFALQLCPADDDQLFALLKLFVLHQADDAFIRKAVEALRGKQVALPDCLPVIEWLLVKGGSTFAPALLDVLLRQDRSTDRSLVELVIASEDPAHMARACQSLLTTIDLKLVRDVAQYLRAAAHRAAVDWLCAASLPPQALNAAVGYLAKRVGQMENALSCIQTVGVGNMLAELDFLLPEPHDHLVWLLTLHSTNQFDALLAAIKKQQIPLGGLRTVCTAIAQDPPLAVGTLLSWFATWTFADITTLYSNHPDAFRSPARVPRLLQFSAIHPESEPIAFALQTCHDDDGLLDQLLTLLTLYWAHRLQVRDEVTRASGDVARAATRLATLAKFGFQPDLIAQGEGLASVAAEQQYQAEKTTAETTYDPANVKEFSALSKAAQTRITKGGKLNNKTEQTAKTKYQEASQNRKNAVDAAEAGKETTFASELNTLGDLAAAALPVLGEKLTLRLLKVTAGNHKLAQSLLAMLTAQSDPHDTQLLDPVVTTSDPLTYATTCRQLLLSKVPLANAFTACQGILTLNNPPCTAWITTQASIKQAGELAAYLKYLTSHQQHLGNALSCIQTLDLSSDLFDLECILGEKAPDVQWLLTLHGAPVFSSLVTYISLTKPKLTTLRTLWTFNSANQNYPAATLIQLCNSLGLDRVLPALQETIYEPTEEFVRSYIGLNANPGSTLQFLQLIRLESLLKANPGHVLTVYQPDVYYAGSHDPPSRTGFLHFVFTSAFPGHGAPSQTAVIHVHWNVNKRRLSSIHIQDINGANGVEVNSWGAFFPTVNQAVLAALNAAVGTANGPTTAPPNQSLTL